MSTVERVSLVLAVPAVLALTGCGEDAPDTMVTTADTVAEVGLQTPESVLHDTDADVYLVSNINGTPTDEDGNGFISRVTPDGEVAALKWIDGQAEGVTLNAPKGMALKGDTLFVTDITHVRAFHRETGEPLESREVPDATFLNDLAVGPEGTLYVSDSGLNPDFSTSGTDAIYRFEGGEPVALVQDPALAGPNGLAVTETGLVFVGFGGAEVRTVGPDGDTEVIAELPGGQLDGVEVLADGSMLVSSWETGSVYHVRLGEDDPTAVVSGVPSPADIGWDADRSRVLIPVFNDDRLIFHTVSVDPGPGAMEQPAY
ncbi:MAG: SMP-30/gluconolactonase/LRE family protein [Gemmatimonadota bacterium]